MQSSMLAVSWCMVSCDSHPTSRKSGLTRVSNIIVVFVIVIVTAIVIVIVIVIISASRFGSSLSSRQVARRSQIKLITSSRTIRGARQLMKSDGSSLGWATIPGNMITENRAAEKKVFRINKTVIFVI